MRRLQPFPKGSNQNVRWLRCMACWGASPSYATRLATARFGWNASPKSYVNTP